MYVWWWIGLLLNAKQWVWSWRAFGAWITHSTPFAFGAESLGPRAGRPFQRFLFFFFSFVFSLSAGRLGGRHLQKRVFLLLDGRWWVGHVISCGR